MNRCGVMDRQATRRLNRSLVVAAAVLISALCFLAVFALVFLALLFPDLIGSGGD